MSVLVAMMGTIVLLAASTRDEQIAHDMAMGRLFEWSGYLLAGLGFLGIIIAIPVAIYQDRKKARRKAAKAKTPPDQHPQA